MIVFVLSLGFYITPDLLGGSSNQVYAVLLAKAVKLNSTRPGLPAAMATILLLVALVVLAVCARLVSVNDLWVSETRQQVWRQRSEGRQRRRLVASLSGRRARRVSQLRMGKLPHWLNILPGTLLAGLAIALSIVPIFVALVFSFARSIFLPFPPTEFTLKWYYTFAESTRWYDAITTSITMGLAVAVLVTLISALTAIAVVRGRFPGKQWVISLILSPLIIPHVAIAVGLWHLFFVVGLSGTWPGVIIAHMIPAIPVTTIVIAADLHNFDRKLEQVARGLGASPVRAFVAVTFPILQIRIPGRRLLRLSRQPGRAGVHALSCGLLDPHSAASPVGGSARQARPGARGGLGGRGSAGP